MKGMVKRRERYVKRTAPMVACGECGYEANVPRAHCVKCGANRPVLVKAPRRKPRYFEEKHGIALWQWAQAQSGAYPDLAKLYHVPNGGARSELEGKLLKAQGVVKGVLDYNLDVACGGYFGLRIELKATKEELGKAPAVSPEQRERIDTLIADGYMAVVCEGWDAARAVLADYVALPRTRGGV